MTTKAPDTYARLAAAIIIAAVVVGAGIVATSFLTSTTVTKTITTGFIYPCSEQVWSASHNANISTVPVLLMHPSSTAYICVTYESAWGGNATKYTTQDSSTYRFGLLIHSYQCDSGAAAGCTGGWSIVLNHNFQISATPNLIQPVPETNFVTVVYTVQALSNSTGFYESAPFDYCNSMPMAVGYTASQVNASDFGGFSLGLGCIYVPFIPSSVSIGGMNVTYITFQL